MQGKFLIFIDPVRLLGFVHGSIPYVNTTEESLLDRTRSQNLNEQRNSLARRTGMCFVRFYTLLVLIFLY